MGKKKKEIRILKKDSNYSEYTFVSSDNILNNTKNNESTNNEKKPENNLMRELKKRFTQRK